MYIKRKKPYSIKIILNLAHEANVSSYGSKILPKVLQLYDLQIHIQRFGKV